MAKYDLLPVGSYQNRKPTVEEFAQRYNIDLTPTQEESTILSDAGNYGLDLAKGVVGWGEVPIGLADLATGGYAGKLLHDYTRYDPKRTKDTLSSNYSSDRQKANQEVENAQGFLDTATAMLKNPSTLAGTVIESAPSMIGGGGLARIIGKGGVLANNPVARGAIGEGLVSGGQTAEQIRQENPDGLLTGRQSLASLASGATTGAIGFGGGRLAQRLGILDPQTILAGGSKLPKGLSKQTFGNVVKGFISEGALQELPQSATEQMWQNYAQDKPLLEGVPEAAATGLLAGGVMGAGANLAHTRGSRSQPEANQQANSQHEPDLPNNPNTPLDPKFNPNLDGRYDPVIADLQKNNQTAYSPVAETLARGVTNNLPTAPTGTISKALMAGGLNQEVGTTRQVLEGELVDALPAELQQREAIDSWLDGDYRNIPPNQLDQNLNRITYNPDLDENGNLPRLYAPNSRAREVTVEQLRDIVRNINTDNVTSKQLMAYTGSNHIQASKAIREVKQEIDTLRKDFDSLSQANKALSKLADKSSFEVGRLANDRFAILPRGVNSALPNGFVARGRAIVAENPTSPPSPQRKSLVQRNNTINDLHTRVPQESVDVIADNYQGNVSPMQLMTESGGSYSQALTSLRRFNPTIQENTQETVSQPIETQTLQETNTNQSLPVEQPVPIEQTQPIETQVEQQDSQSVSQETTETKPAKEVIKSSEQEKENKVSGKKESAEKKEAQTEKAEKASEDTPKEKRVRKTKQSTANQQKATNQQDKIKDAGQNLFYNKKNLWNDNGLTWNDIANENTTLQAKLAVKNKIWAKPDWEKVVRDIDSEKPSEAVKIAAHLIKNVYDSVAKEPFKKDEQSLKDYIKYVTEVREAANDFLNNKENIDQLTSLFKYNASINRNVKPLFEKLFPMINNTFSFRDNPEVSNKARLLGGNKFLNSLQWNSSTLNKISNNIKEGWPTPMMAWQRQGYKIIDKADLKPSVEQLSNKGDTRYVPSIRLGYKRVLVLRDKENNYVSYKNIEQATERASKLYDELSDYVVIDKLQNFVSSHYTNAQAIEGAKEAVNTKRKTNNPEEASGVSINEVVREGVERRLNNKNVSSDELMQAFGFRGVNFGNYVTQNERQTNLNHAYDSFYDLAEILNLPPKAMSLDGLLGIAFGAQGRGKALAHFVPGYNEINITRRAGAGSLAHEWGHALDHYFGIQAGLASSSEPFASEYMKRYNPTKQEPEIRPEVLDRFKSIVETMQSMKENEQDAIERNKQYLEWSKQRLDKFIDRLGIQEQINQSPKANQALEDIRKGEAGEYVPIPSRKRRGESVTKNAKIIADELNLSKEQMLAFSEASSSISYATEVQNKDVELRNIHTKFYKNSLGRDSGKQKPYWSTKLEMFARAFESYTLDKLAENNQRNDYLVADRKAETDKAVNDDLYPYPAGEERVKINKAFDELINEIKTKEGTNGNIALYKRSISNNPASNANTLKETVNNRVKQWKNAPKVEVVQSINDLPEAAKQQVINDEAYDANGIHYNGEVYLIADNISTPKQALFVTEHEVLGHYGLRGLFGNTLDPILNNIYKTNQAVKVQADRLVEQYGYDKVLATEEVLADMAATGDIQSMSFWNKLVAAFRNFSRKLGLPTNWTNSDISYLLSNARRFVEKGANSNSTIGIQYSRVGQFVNAGLDRLNTKLDTSQQISDHVSPEQRKIMQEKMAMFQPKSIKDKFNEVSHNLGEKLVQGIFDSFAPLKNLNEEAYMQAHLSKGTEGAVEALLRIGKPMLREGAYDVDNDGGLFKVLSELNSNGTNELNEWLSWMAANRAEILKRQGRENLFTSEEIQELKKLNEGTMPDGRNRAKVYENVRKQVMSYNKAVLDIAEQSGLIDKANRKTWENGFYLPFYRVAEEDASYSIGNVNKMVGQQAFKKLKGGTQALDDLLVNMVSNWSHLLTASMRNQAGYKSLKSAVNMGVADKLDRLRAGEYMNTRTDQFRKGGQNVVWVMENGQQEYYQVNDPLVFDALNMINHPGWNNPLIKVMGKFKTALTVGVTSSPTFRVRNLIRDTLQAAAISNIGYNPIANVINGFNSTKAGSETMNRLIAGGGAIRFGASNDGNQGNQHRRLIKELGIKDNQILDTQEKVKNALGKAWNWYKETGDRAETINRATIYEKAIADGKSHLQASFEARDLMNFTSAGKWASVRFLSQVLPFFNARLQGMYKLGRAAKSDPKRFALVTGAVALASSLLYLLQKDDDDYKELPDWVRDTYWYVKLGDQALYIPKPFEIGALGSIAERGLEFSLAGDDYTASDFASTVTSILSDQLAMNPVPQIAKPAIEAAFNYDTFRGAAIDSMGQERLAARDRYTANTSTGAILAGRALNISPQRLEHLTRGYFGWLGTQALNVTDIATRPLTDLPSNPNRDLGQINNIFMLGDFVKKSEIGAGSKYLSRFYDSQSKIDQVYASLTNARKIGELDYATELAKDDKLKLRRLYTTTGNNISKISQQIRAVRADKNLSSSDKTERIDVLQRQRNQLAKMADERARASGYL